MTEHLVEYPFVQEEVTLFDEDGPHTIQGWRPGVSFEPDDGTEDGAGWADGIGKMVLSEIDSHKLPRPYPERVFYLREWIDPKGRRFGKRNLRVTTRAAFTRMLRGYRHEFEYDPPSPSTQQERAE